MAMDLCPANSVVPWAASPLFDSLSSMSQSSHPLIPTRSQRVKRARGGGGEEMEMRYFRCSLLTASFPPHHINFTLSRRTALSLSSASKRVTGMGGGVSRFPPSLHHACDLESSLVASFLAVVPTRGCSPCRGTWGMGGPSPRAASQ